MPQNVPPEIIVLANKHTHIALNTAFLVNRFSFYTRGRED